MINVYITNRYIDIGIVNTKLDRHVCYGLPTCFYHGPKTAMVLMA